MPRHKDAKFDDLGFIFIRENNTYKASCVLCNKKLTNTGLNRLQSHRNYCTVDGVVRNRKKKAVQGNTSVSSSDGEATRLIIEEIIGHSSISPVVIDLDDDSTDLVNVVVSEEETTTARITHAKSPNTSAATTLSSQSTSTTGCKTTATAGNVLYSSTPKLAPSPAIQNKLLKKQTAKWKMANADSTAHKTGISTSDADISSSESITQELKGWLDKKLSDFIFGCDIPFDVVESTNFKNFVAALRPSYLTKLPSSQELGTQLLDATYNRCLIDQLKQFDGQPSVLIVDEWQRSEYSPCKVIVALLHNAGVGKESAYLGAHHATYDDDDDDNDSYIAFVRNSVYAAQDTYRTQVYAVVGDRVSANTNAMHSTNSVWCSPCYLGLANSLAQDVLDQELDKKVTFVLGQFKRAIWHQALMLAGGQPVLMPQCDSCHSHRESYISLIHNAPFMKSIVDNDTFQPSTGQRQLVRELLADTTFLEGVKERASALEPICWLIDVCGAPNANLADAVHVWLNTQLDENEQFQRVFERYKKVALTKYALAAYFLHPKHQYYERSSEMSRATDSDSKMHFMTVQDFLLEALDADGIEAFDYFQNGIGIMKTLLAKNVQNPAVFWRMVKPHHPLMADVALRLLSIPATASRINRQFYRRSYAHDALAAASDRSPLSLEQCEKLLRVYYARRSEDDFVSPEF